LCHDPQAFGAIMRLLGPTMVPETRYAMSGGVNIAYQVLGNRVSRQHSATATGTTCLTVTTPWSAAN
jgi:hypothetical protein